jgi:hypothetical protein
MSKLKLEVNRLVDGRISTQAVIDTAHDRAKQGKYI